MCGKKSALTGSRVEVNVFLFLFFSCLGRLLFVFCFVFLATLASVKLTLPFILFYFLFFRVFIDL